MNSPHSLKNKHEETAGLTQQRLFLEAAAEAEPLVLHRFVVALHVVELDRQLQFGRDQPADRRRHMVELTDAGRAAVERAETAREGIEDDVLSDLSVEERKALRKLLKRVLEGLLRVPAEAPSPA